MIRQSGLNPADIAIGPQPATTPADEGQWRGLDVFRLGSELVRSINPFCEPPDSRQPAPYIAGSTAGKDAQDPDDRVSHFLQATALATRAVATYTNLPAEINNLLGYLANLSVVGRFANDQLNDCAGWVPGPG
ncbi:hypothetical protein, partial [Endozoicomonas sp. ONNA2]|uniref:hypothetical protein n=1 Tax=Endozoicomonas sp. ONNA2 TaxID=2828741 RepID=UPI002148BFC2